MANPHSNVSADLQNWRTKLDSQVKVYHDELSEVKKSLNTEVEQLRSHFQDLRTTLQQQHGDVTICLRNLGDGSGKITEDEGSENLENIKETAEDLPKEDNRKGTDERA